MNVRPHAVCSPLRNVNDPPVPIPAFLLDRDDIGMSESAAVHTKQSHTPPLNNIVTLLSVISLVKSKKSLNFSNLHSGKERVMEKERNFDERYHASYAAKLKTIPLDKVEKAIAKVIGELTQDHLECIITKFKAKSQYAEITVALSIGTDKRYFK